jgi:hypothetical protein
MGFIVDEHPICALSPYCPYPAFGKTVRLGRLRRRLHHPNALADQNIIERGCELGVTIADEEPGRADPVCEANDQVAGLLGGPDGVRVPGHPKNVVS